MRCSTDKISARNEPKRAPCSPRQHRDTPQKQYAQYDEEDDTDSDLERSDNLSSYLATSHSTLNETESFNPNTSSEADSFSRNKHDRSLTRLAVPPEETLTNFGHSLFVIVIIAILCGTLAILFGKLILIRSPEMTEIKHPVCNFKELKAKFKYQNDMLWKSLQLGTESVVKQNSPSVFLFVYRDDAGQLLNEIIQMASKCLETGVDPLIMNSSDFTKAEMESDYGVAIHEIRPKLIKSQVMLVTDLNKISANVAQAFHTICDPITPLVGRSVIFLTMHLDINLEETRPLLQLVEEQLLHDWRGLEENILNPLLTRVTDQVLLLK